MIYFQEKNSSQDLNKYLVKKNEIVITTRGEVAKIAINDSNEEIFFNSNICLLETDQTLVFNRYLYHYLLKKQTLIKSLSHKTALQMLNIEKLKEITIPLPSLEKQKEIANLLDKFWKLSEELEEELSLRKQQYEYYRDELLSFKQDNKIEWLTLGEIFKFIGGFPFEISKYKSKGFPILRINNICECLIDNKNLVFFSKGDYEQNLDSYILRPNDLFISNAGTLKIGFNNQNFDYWINQRIYKLDIDKEKYNWKYLFHWLVNNIYYISNFSSSSNMVPNWSTTKMKKIKIPIPSLEKQQEIVDLLDKFWELSNSIKEGLPSEILMRKQQYEYYRDKLLN